MGRPQASGTGIDHRLAWVTAGLRRAARDAGVDLPAVYARQVAADGLRSCDQLGVTRLDTGVVLHTAPDTPDQLPAVLGYADTTGQWYRDGSRHTPRNPRPARPSPTAHTVGL